MVMMKELSADELQRPRLWYELSLTSARCRRLGERSHLAATLAVDALKRHAETPGTPITANNILDIVDAELKGWDHG